MRFRSLFACLLLGACTFELEPLATGSDAGSSGGSGATGGTSSDADCVTLGCQTGGSTSGGTGAATSGGVSGGGAPPGGGAGGTPLGGSGGVPTGGTGAGGGATGGTGAGGTGTGGGGAGGSGGSTFTCTNISQLPSCSDPNQAACRCEGCDPVFCLDPVFGDPISDCVCPSCWFHPDCSTQYCVNDGLCDPFIEGCDCADCFYHPECF